MFDYIVQDQLQVAAPVSSGMGMTLLQKMGWRPGEGLGKNKEGTLQPLLLDIKLDKKGDQEFILTNLYHTKFGCYHFPNRNLRH